ncbi:unnamed protein product [Pleuronectes platessa]|uniref:Uncharacterized protein n=1 Tax=Pleuronectes platessa TaxID=8262 RepID=A0A9N7VEG9_PLEPL|nr:unnamed protein product [Pleuronectes platessa]
MHNMLNAEADELKRRKAVSGSAPGPGAVCPRRPGVDCALCRGVSTKCPEVPRLNLLRIEGEFQEAGDRLSGHRAVSKR